MSNLMNEVDYAAHRRANGLPGGTRQAVRKAIRDARIVKDASGMIEQRSADRDWKKHTRPSVNSISLMSYAAARAERERYQARMARLDYLERRGELLPTGEVRDAIFKIHRNIRDLLLSLPTRVAPELVSKSSLHEVESILDREVCRLCDELSTPLTVKAAVLNESEDAPEQAS